MSVQMRTMLDVADNWLNLRRLELTVYVDNEAAIALYKKFGFIIEGRLRQDAFRAGEFVVFDCRITNGVEGVPDASFDDGFHRIGPRSDRANHVERVKPGCASTAS